MAILSLRGKLFLGAIFALAVITYLHLKGLVNERVSPPDLNTNQKKRKLQLNSYPTPNKGKFSTIIASAYCIRLIKYVNKKTRPLPTTQRRHSQTLLLVPRKPYSWITIVSIYPLAQVPHPCTSTNKNSCTCSECTFNIPVDLITCGVLPRKWQHQPLQN